MLKLEWGGKEECLLEHTMPTDKQFIINQEKTDAYKAGYKKISDITSERIKRAGTKILEENPDIQLDVGFKVHNIINML